ncbi:hypothetical protein BGZ83_004662 [Gryganskiella cystojenkinii]|nr:hypothetical protein BGZ83_004662 [Gryganskiella cystojenkinii]
MLMPNLIGKNAVMAVDELKKLGLPRKSIELSAADSHKLVLDPVNWTVIKQSIQAGALLEPDTLVVLGCKKGS